MTRQPDADIYEDVYRTSGMVMPSGFVEYDHLTGYVSGMYASQWVDKDGTVYVRTTTVINLGRPDRGTPADPDKLLAEEDWGRCPNTRAAVEAAADGRRRKRARNLIDNRAIIEPVLRAHGPMSVYELAEHVDMAPRAVEYHVKALEGTVYQKTVRRGGGHGIAHFWSVMEDER